MPVMANSASASRGSGPLGSRHPMELAALQKGGEHQLRHPLGQRRDGGQDQGRRPADEDRQRQGLAALLGDVVVEPAPFLDLPVHAEGVRIVPLDAVDAEVVLAAVRVLGVDERQGDEVAAVLGPGLDQGQAAKVGGGLPALENRTAADGAQPQAHPFPRQPAVAPEPARRQRGELVRHLDQLSQKALRPRSERQVDPAGCPEQVGDRGEVGPFDALEQQRRSARGDDAAVDLGQFEIGVDRGFDPRQLPLFFKQLEEGSKVVHERRPIGATVGKSSLAATAGGRFGSDRPGTRADRIQYR